MVLLLHNWFSVCLSVIIAIMSAVWYISALCLQTMYVAEWTQEQGWNGEMRPYGPLHLEPSAQVNIILLQTSLHTPEFWSATQTAIDITGQLLAL